MSSHHIVREKQEPALLIMHYQQEQEELLGQLLEWSPTVIVVEDEYERIDSLGIKIDRVITSSTHLPFLQEDILTIHTEQSLLEAALNHLCLEKYPAVNILTQEFDSKIYLPYTDKINWVVCLSKHRIFPVKSGFSKWKAKGEIIEILSDSIDLKTEGLQEIGDRRYTIKNEGMYTLQFNQPFIFVAEEY